MKYKVGDTVTIKKDLAVGEHYGVYGVSNFIEDMVKHQGEQAKIVDIVNTHYELDIDNGFYYWTDEMLEDTNWQQGDIITDGLWYRRILGVCGEVVFTTISYGRLENAIFGYEAGNNHTQKGLEGLGWHLYTEPVQEETIDLFDKTYKKEEIEKALKKIKPIN